MTRVTKRDRHRMRRKTAKLGEEYVEQGVAPARAAAWGLTSEQAVELADVAIEAATKRRRKGRRR